MISTQHLPIYENYQITPKLEAAEAINRIIRGEISAVEAYKKTLEKITNRPERERLGEIKKFHEEQVSHWMEQVDSKGLTPDTESGPWGSVVKSLVGVANFIGDSPSLIALEQGEFHGLREYNNFLENDFVSHRNKAYVKDTVIPHLELHTVSLKALKKLH